jgi:DNA-directed RNA polymerase specialized sigma24 family protein
LGREEGRQALDALLHRYLPPLKAYLTIHRKILPDRADDLLQDFLTDKVLQKDLIARADQKKGKFRTFLLAALDRFLIDRARREAMRTKCDGRPAGSMDGADPRTLVAPDPHVLGKAWARQVIAMARDRLEKECKASGRCHVWEIFLCRFLDPLLEGVPPVQYKELLGRMDIQSPAQAAKLAPAGKGRGDTLYAIASPSWSVALTRNCSVCPMATVCGPIGAKTGARFTLPTVMAIVSSATSGLEPAGGTSCTKKWMSG